MGGFQCQSVSVSKQCHAHCSRSSANQCQGKTVGNCAEACANITIG